MWDDSYRTTDYIFGTEPSHFLVNMRERLPKSGKALSIADGEGRNGVFLARQGLDVLSVDLSSVGLAKAQKLAEMHGVRIETEQADLTSWNWPVDRFDVVVAIFIQPFGPKARQVLFDNMVAALRPGGRLFLEGYRKEQLQYGTGGPSVLENLYSEDQLRAELAALRIESVESYDRELHEGNRHVGMSALIDLVAVKR